MNRLYLIPSYLLLIIRSKIIIFTEYLRYKHKEKKSIYTNMKSMLYGQLRELARKILEAPEGEMSSLQNDARVLYEKLTVLRYTEGLVEELKNSMDMAAAAQENACPPDDEGMDGVEFPVQQENIVIIQETEEAPFSGDNAPVDENISGGDTQREEGTNVGTLDEGTAVHADDITTVTEAEYTAYVETAAQDIAEKAQDDLSAGQDEGNEMRKEQKRRKTPQKEQYDELQQSLFDQDIFSKEIIGFDPDEDLFEINDNTAAGSCQEHERTHIQDGGDTAGQFSGGDDTDGSMAADEGEGYVKNDNDDDAGNFFAFEVVSSSDVETNDEPEDVENDAQQHDIDAEWPVADPGDAAGWQEEDNLTPGKKDGYDAVAGMDDGKNADTTDGDTICDDDDNAAVQYTDRENIHTVNDTLSSDQPRLSLNEILASKNVSIGLNDRIAFINNLFDGDTEAFETSVKYIFSLSDIDVANEYILEILKPSYNNWFEKEKYERRFVSLILQHFYKK